MRGHYLIIYNNTPGDFSLKGLFAVRGNERGNGGMEGGRLLFARGVNKIDKRD